MSEYQYYEFLAVDRPLNDLQLAEVRSLSTRASVTATSFVNEYHWGNFRGDPKQMMERYYDAHLYLANWGTHRIMLRLPRSLLDLDVARGYCAGDLVTAWTTGKFLVLDLTSEDEGGEWDPDAVIPLSAIVGIRSELATGDLRPLYLAWLAGHNTAEADDYSWGRNPRRRPRATRAARIGHAHRRPASAGRLPPPRRRPTRRRSPDQPTARGDHRHLRRTRSLGDNTAPR